jgi:hypothetical protein
MARPKKKYVNPAPQLVPAPAPPALPGPLPYSFDLRGASAFTGFSVWSLRLEITSGRLRIVNRKPYLIRRSDLEEFVDSRVQRIEISDGLR